MFAQLRCGILPLKIETGRYTQIPAEFRLCTFCDCNAVEDEMHFLFDCSFYNDLRRECWLKFEVLSPNFMIQNNEEKFNLLMSSDLVKTAGEYVYNCYNKRKGHLYCNT